MRARDNPYRVKRIHSLAFRFRGTDMDRIWARLQIGGRRACVLGPHGSGKTTLLGGLAERLRDNGFSVRVETVRADDRRRPRPERWCDEMGPRGMLLVDGADMLRHGEWRRLRNASSRAGGLIVTSHRRPLLPVVYECRPTAELLEELMRELHPFEGCGQPSAHELFARHLGDLREAFWDLFEFHAERGRGACREPEPSSHRHPTRPAEARKAKGSDDSRRAGLPTALEA